MKNLFVYGTLIDFDIMNNVCGEIFRSELAVLHGYRCERVSGEVYPAIVEADRGFVEGRLYFDVPVPALARIDQYEGNQYVRREVVIETINLKRLSAQAYVVAAAHRERMTGELWSFEEFLARDKDLFLKSILN